MAEAQVVAPLEPDAGREQRRVPARGVVPHPPRGRGLAGRDDLRQPVGRDELDAERAALVRQLLQDDVTGMVGVVAQQEQGHGSLSLRGPTPVARVPRHRRELRIAARTVTADPSGATPPASASYSADPTANSASRPSASAWMPHPYRLPRSLDRRHARGVA